MSLGEFDRIALFRESFAKAGGPVRSASILLGPGDDAALLVGGSPLAVTTDAVVEGVHFRREWSTWEQTGHKALAVNLSDLAAMGAMPVGFLCSLILPPDVDDEAVAQLATGMGRLAGHFGAVLLGGNFSRAHEASVTITAFGSVGERYLRRDAAKVGDLVVLIGDVGVAAAELAWLEAGKTLPPGRSALLEPEPRVGDGLLAVEMERSGCAIDISDGLVQDLSHVARASGVAIRIDYDEIPASARFKILTDNVEPDRRAQFVVAGGEDYALAVIAPPGGAMKLASATGGALIGRVEAGAGVHVDHLPAGTAIDGHDHFARV